MLSDIIHNFKADILTFSVIIQPENEIGRIGCFRLQVLNDILLNTVIRYFFQQIFM